MSMTVEEAIESVKELKAYNKNGELTTPVNEGISMWWDGVFGKVLDCLSEVQQLHAIGTVSEFRQLKEKATAKKPIYSDFDENEDEEIIPYKAVCPVCGYEFEFGTWNDVENHHCECGQRMLCG